VHVLLVQIADTGYTGAGSAYLVRSVDAAHCHGAADGCCNVSGSYQQLFHSINSFSPGALSASICMPLLLESMLVQLLACIMFVLAHF
jgi:hypothetical protein